VQSLYPTTPSELSDDDLAELYAYPSERPWLRTNFVSTLDGAAQGTDHRAGTISSPADQRLFALLRSLCDVIIAGANTARVEGYHPVTPSEARATTRTSRGLAPVPAIAVVSRSLRLDPILVRGGEAPTIVITTESAPSDVRKDIAAVARVVVAGERDVDFAAAREALVAMGHRRMLCEGGPTLMRDVVASGQVDDLCLTVTPLLIAGDRMRMAHGPSIEPAPRMRLRHVLEADGDLFFRYTRG